MKEGQPEFHFVRKGTDFSFLTLKGAFPVPEVGEVIWLYQRDYSKGEKWKVEPFGGNFKVVEVHKEYGKRYPHTPRVNDIRDSCYVTITVEEVKDD